MTSRSSVVILFLTMSSFLLEFSAYAQSSEQLTEIKTKMSGIWDAREASFKDRITRGCSGDLTTYQLYEIQDETNNLLVYAINEKDYPLLVKMATVYLTAAETPNLAQIEKKKVVRSDNTVICEAHFNREWPAWINRNGSEDVLSSAQFLYMMAKALNSFQQIPTSVRSQYSTLNTFIQTYTPIVESHYQRWFTVDKTFQVKGWECYTADRLNNNDDCYNAKSLIQNKLDLKFKLHGDPSYCNIIEDRDMWMIAGVAEILAANKQNPAIIPLTVDNIVLFQEFVQIGTTLLKSRSKTTTFNESSGQVFGVVLDTDYLQYHPDYKYAGRTTTSSCPSLPNYTVPISWDVSHARRWVHTFESLFESRHATGQSFPDLEFMTKMANQFYYKVYDETSTYPRFNNYFDGKNGWYRYYLNTDINKFSGWGPYQHSMAGITGGYCFWSKYNSSIATLRSDLWNMMKLEAENDANVQAFYAKYYGTSYECNGSGLTIKQTRDRNAEFLQFLPTFFPSPVKNLTYADNLISCVKKNNVNAIFKSWSGNTLGHQIYGTPDLSFPVSAITSGNFDGTSDDVVTAFDISGNPAIYKNKDADSPGGDGRVYTSTYWDVLDMCTGDFDGDGDDELVTVFHSSGGEAIYIDENGDAPGDIGVYHTTKWWIVAVTAGDFDGDGDDELIMATRDVSGVTRVFKDEDGSNPESQKIFESSSLKVIDMTAGDFNGTNDDELIIAFRTSNNSEDAIYYSESALSPITSTKTYNSTYWKVASLTSGDFDGNGNDELITAFNSPAGGALYMSETGFSPGSNRIFGVDASVVFTHVTAGQYMTPPNGTRQSTTALMMPEIRQGSNVQLFPNPVTDEFQIVHSEGETIKSIDMYDLTGKSENHFVRVGNKIQVSDLPKGMYIMKVAFETHSWIAKLWIK